MSIKRGMDKEDVVLLYSAIKKNEIMPFTATWVDQKIIILSEICQIENDQYIMILLICEIFFFFLKMIQLNLFTK